MKRCNRFDFNLDLISIKVSTLLLDCEQSNIHLKIEKAEEKELEGTNILPVCMNNEACEKEFYNLRDTNKTFIIKGYLSEKSHNYFDYGCTDSKIFKITNFTEVE